MISQIKKQDFTNSAVQSMVNERELKDYSELGNAKSINFFNVYDTAINLKNIFFIPLNITCRTRNL